MDKIGAISIVNLFNCSNVQNSMKTNDIPFDSFVYSEPKVEKKGFAERIVNLFSLNGNKVEDKNSKFVQEAENKINFSSSDFEKIKKTSEMFYKDALSLLEYVEKNENNDNENIVTSSIVYKGDRYRAIAIVDDNGFIDRVIHDKDGKINTIYDIKTPVKAGKERIFSDDTNKTIIADCYFYNEDNNEYMRNIKNSILNYNAVYDFQNGGIKRVNQNLDNSPIEVYAEWKDGQYSNYHSNYGGKKEETISIEELDDGANEIKYKKTKCFLGINKLKTTKSYSCYEYQG